MNEPRTIQCPECRGMGDCPTCDGTGKVEAARTADRPSLRPATRQMAYFLFNLGYPYDVQVRDSDGDPVLPPIEALDALIEEWRLHEVKPDTDETRDDYRDSFAIELGIDPWAAALRQALEGEEADLRSGRSTEAAHE